jgi:hypothetical protein
LPAAKPTHKPEGATTSTFPSSPEVEPLALQLRQAAAAVHALAAVKSAGAVVAQQVPGASAVAY